MITSLSTSICILWCECTSSLSTVWFWFEQAKVDVSKDALLSDICLGTSAAPTFLPGHYFETKDAKGNTRSFDLIDGGVAANNPVSIAEVWIQFELC